MTTPTLRQLRYFEALARHRHFGRAADDCAVSQPALSTQIRELEATLGAPLFERMARQVRLTEAGAAVAGRIRAILRSVEELGPAVRAARDGPPERLRLGVIPTVGPYLLPRLLADLGAAWPGLDLQVRETLTGRLVAELGEGRLDAAIVALPIAEAGLSEVPLFDEEFVLVRPAAEAGRPVPGPEGLARMRLLLLEEGHCFRDQALSFCRMAPGGVRDLLDATSLTTLVQMVASGVGVTLIPEMAVPVETRAAAVNLARFPAPAPRRTVGMIWRRANPLARQLEAVAARLRRPAASPGDKDAGAAA